MNPLRLQPLPILRADDESGSLLLEREGFVDEAAVAALMMGPIATSRQSPYPQDLALAADDLDFAGWQLSPPPHPRIFEKIAIDEIANRRPAPPEMTEPGLDIPHSGSHRWWLAGLAGILSTMLFSVLLMNLSARPGTRLEVFFAPKQPSSSKAVDSQKPDANQPAPELTTLLGE